jgi:biotin transport system substrate-specific component
MSQSGEEINKKEKIPQLSHAKEIALCALMCALLIVSSFITVPFGPVPFTLQTFVMPLIILLLEPKQVAETTGLYLLMGAIGLPVFSGMQGGLGHIVGPTGGFLVSYLLGGTFASFVRCALYKRSGKRVLSDIISLIIFLIICYALGWAWLMVAAQISAAAAFTSGVIPFIFIDIFKYIAAFAVAKVVRIALKMY